MLTLRSRRRPAAAAPAGRPAAAGGLAAAARPAALALSLALALAAGAAVFTLAAGAIALVGEAAAPGGTAAQSPRAVLDRAVDDFAAGRLQAAADGFDRVAALAPQAAPQLWQRGIALYYVGRYADCRDQFVSHRRVNPNDVENAAWHYLCVARADSAAAARAALLPVGPDGRAPMREIYEMFRGDATPASVLAAGERAAARGRPSGLFYAHLYIGLFHEAHGRAADARPHLDAAADAAYARAGGYMHMVARIHVDQLAAAAPPP